MLILMEDIHAYYEGCLMGKIHAYSYGEDPCLFLWRISMLILMKVI